MKPLTPSWLYEEIHRRFGSIAKHHESYPDSYPSELEGSLTLTDGTRLRIRPIRPEDTAALKAGFHDLSPETVYRRFHTQVETLSEEACRYLTHIDYQSHLALVAVDEDRGVAVARYYRPEGSDMAEAAVVVVDAWQGRGVGPALLERLISAASDRGISGFEAFVQEDNRRLLKVLEKSGYRFRTVLDGQTLHVELPFAQPATLDGGPTGKD